MEIAVDKVQAFIDRVRGFEAQTDVVDPDPASNGVDDGMTDILQGGPDDPTEQELISFINGLNVDEQLDLVALVWVGREDFEAEDWGAALRAARERREGSTAAYLLSIPNVGDLMAEGLAAVSERQDLPATREAERKRAPPRGLHPELDEQNSGAPPEQPD